MYIEVPTNKFKKDLKLAKKQGKDLTLLEEVIDLIKSGQPLDSKYNEHYLTGQYKGSRECHVKPDWLLIYRIDTKLNKLYLVRTGTHSELFNESFNLFTSLVI